MIEDHELDFLGRRLVKALSTPIVPLFYKDNRNVPMHHGNAVLVSYYQEIFLVSAAHILQKAHDVDLFFYVREKAGCLVRGPSMMTAKDSKLDIGVIKLHRHKLNDYNFTSKKPIPFDNLLFNSLPRDNKSYFLLGVPGSKSKLHYTKKFVNTQYDSLITKSSPYSVYNNRNVNPYNHLALD